MPQRYSPAPRGRLGGHTVVYRCAVLAALLAAASGCSIFKTEAPADPVPELPEAFGTEVRDDVAADAQLGPGDWVDDFEDPQLLALVQEALEHNRKFLSALAKHDAASARYAAEFAARLPRVDLQGQAQRQKFINDIVRSSSIDIDPQVYPTRLILGAGINWELDLWGRVADQSHAARDEAEAATLEVQAAGFSLAAQTTTQWFGLVAAEKRRQLAQRVVDSYDETVKRSEQRFERGLITAVELRQAMAEAEGARSELLARELEVGRTRRAFEVLLGRYPSNEIQAAEALPPLPPSLPSGVPGQLIERRPDVAAAALRLRANDERLLASKKNLLPRFSISLTGGTQSKYRDLLFTDDSTIWSIGGNALLPLFDGGATRAGIDAQRALLQDALAQYQDKVLSACLEVEDALAAESLIREQVERMRNASVQMQSMVSSVEKRFEIGLLDLRAVLSARRSAWQAEQRALETELLALNNRVAMYLALGGGLQEADDAAAEAAAGTDVEVEVEAEVETDVEGAEAVEAIPLVEDGQADMEAPAQLEIETFINETAVDTPAPEEPEPAAAAPELDDDDASQALDTETLSDSDYEALDVAPTVPEEPEVMASADEPPPATEDEPAVEDETAAEAPSDTEEEAALEAERQRNLDALLATDPTLRSRSDDSDEEAP